MILKSYTLEIIADDVVTGTRTDDWYMSDQRVEADLPAIVEEVEENLTDLLPEGYRARIRNGHV